MNFKARKNNMQKIRFVAPAALLTITIFSAMLTFGQQVPPPPGAQAANDTARVPSGTTIRAELTTLLTTRTSKSGDPFTARVAEPVFGGGTEIVPANSTVEGHVSFVKSPGRVTGVAEMRLVADSITTPEGTVYTVAAGLQDAQGAEGAKVKGEEGTIQGSGKSTKDAAKETGIEAGVGAGVGAIADGGTGSLYGLGIGAITGVAHTLFKKHKDLILPQGTELSFVLSRDAVAKKAEKPTDTSSQ